MTDGRVSGKVREAGFVPTSNDGAPYSKISVHLALKGGNINKVPVVGTLRYDYGTLSYR